MARRIGTLLAMLIASIALLSLPHRAPRPQRLCQPVGDRHVCGPAEAQDAIRECARLVAVREQSRAAEKTDAIARCEAIASALK